MALLRRNKTPVVSKQQSSEIGVAGNVVFEGFEKEESRADKVTIADYRDMIDKDPTVESFFNIFTLPIIAATYRIDADEKDAGNVQADLVRNNLFNPSYKGGMQLPFSLFLDQLLLSIIDGFQLWEKVYMINSDSKIVLKKLAHRDSIGLTLIRDDDNGYGGVRQQVTYGNDVVDVTIPAYKTFLFTHNKARSFLYGRSALRSLRKPYVKKGKLEYLDSIALQSDAIKPKLLKRTSDSVIEKNENGESIRSKILSALAKLGELKPVASIPFGYEVQELTADGRDPHQSIERQNSEMARAWLATFSLLGSQGGSNVGSYALSDNLSDMLMISLKAFMTKVEEHINQYLIADLHTLNFAEPYFSEFHFDDLTSDTVQVIADAFTKLLEKDRISDEMVQGIEEATANRLEIDIVRIKKERKKQAEKDAKANVIPPSNQNGDKANLGDKFLSDDIHDELGIDDSKLGCIMLDVDKLEILKYIDNGTDDLVEAKSGEHLMGAVGEVEPHITLLFGLMESAHNYKDQIDKLYSEAVIESVVIEEVSYFDNPESDSYPIIARVKLTPELLKAHNLMTKLPHANTFIDYKPHITLAYVKKDEVIRDRWVKSLADKYNNSEIKVLGLNYGDKSDDSNDLSDGDGNLWHRALTPAEMTVKFADINKRMDTMEESFISQSNTVLQQYIKELVASDLTAPSYKELKIELPKQYVSIISGSIRTAYNYAKTGAADELKVNAPATSKEALAGVTQYTDFIIGKQQDDIKNIILAERLKLSRSLADNTEENIDDPQLQFNSKVETGLLAWLANILKPTAGAMISTAVNNGRDDVFKEVAKDGDLFQFSGLLDTKICNICRDLDGKVVDLDGYRRSRWNPPIHYHCRCLWILIRKVSETFKMPEVTGLPFTAGGYQAPTL